MRGWPGPNALKILHDNLCEFEQMGRRNVVKVSLEIHHHFLQADFASCLLSMVCIIGCLINVLCLDLEN